MKKAYKLLVWGLFGLFFIAGCVSNGESATSASATMIPTATEVKVFPTPASPGDSILWQGLQVSMVQVEITDSFVTEFGSRRDPTAGNKFFWVHVRLKNIGNKQIDIPTPEHFSVLYVASELKSTYGHRQGYTDYDALDPTLFPQKEVDAWLRFDIPVAAELKDLWFVYLPESSAVGVLPSSPDYPWGGEHPMFAWLCAS